MKSVEMLECHVETYVHVSIRTEWNVLLARLAKQVVHAHEHIEPFGVYVEYPSETCCVAVYGEVDATIYPLQWSHVGTDTAFCPCVFAVDTC